MSTRERLLSSGNRNLRLCVLLLIILSPGLAYTAGPGAAVTHVDRVDADFALQGEFVGTVKTERSKAQPLALQIRADGEGIFAAAQYLGGLPGERGHRPEMVRLTGKRTDDFLVLSGGPWVVLGHPDHCLLINPNGKRVGRLSRVRRQSPTMGATPPKDAVVLFDGSSGDQFDKAELTEDGLLMQGAEMRPLFQDFNLHAEFLLPYMPVSRGQGRANSGLYLLSRYEVQILDSFAMEPVNNGCGGLYKFRAPEVNMCLPPLVWQTYDIVFTAPRWASDGTKLNSARITVWLNGVKIHNDVELADKTGAGRPEESTLLPIRLQDHGNPVRFRNIWIIDRGAAPPVRFPVIRKATGADESPRGPRDGRRSPRRKKR
ncbi:MAG: 3-keto-disaccharide hydrolase [Planctomycetota bacterium]|jgi:hypothetical protein